MADKKITELTPITGANLADADEFVVVDVSTDETLSVTRAEFFKNIPHITGTITSDGLTVATTGEVIGTIGSTSTAGARQATLRLNVASTGGDDPAGRVQFTYGAGYSVAGSIEMTHTNPNMKFLTGTTERMRIDSIGTVRPSADNTQDLGSSSYRWAEIYAGNATINTSDRNEKQDIASLTLAEMLVAARLSTGFINFKWKDMVVEKGDDARLHSGAIAQDVQDAFTAEGLDAGDYAMFISSTWWEHDVDVPAVEAVEASEDVEAVEAKGAYTRTDAYETLEEAPDGATERTRLGIRYPELLSFVAAYNEQRFASIETRLATLEA